MTQQPFQRARGEFPSWGAFLKAAAYALIVGNLLRAADLVLACARPSVLVAYVKLWRSMLRNSPYRDKSYAKIQATKATSLTLSELTYGETPLVTAIVMMRAAGVRRGSVVFDPMAGRGRFLLAARLLGAQARGVEIVEENAYFAAPILARAGIELVQGDGALTDFSDATHAFVCWTCSSDQTRTAIGTALSTMKPGGKVLSVTWLVDVPGFKTLWSRRYLFTWGRGDVALAVRTVDDPSSGAAAGT